jgi:hypothetical protein
MSKPGISCFCSTFGRPKNLLENSIQCFLDQDYDGPKELVILNDLDVQELAFDHPEVRIINHPERIKPLGRKFNYNVELCKYDIVAVWEDDDVFLKNRLSYSIENMKNGIFHTHHAFYERGIKDIILAQNIFHSTHMFTKELFNKVGGYTEADVCSIDVSIMEKFRRELGHYSQDMPVKDRWYIYVWAGANSYHGSGWGPTNESISDSAAQIVQMHLAQGVTLKGRVELEPKLRYNFYEHLPKE